MPNIGERKEIGGTTGEWDGQTWKRVYTNADVQGRPVDPFVPSPGMAGAPAPGGITPEAQEVTSGPGFRTPEFDAKYADAKNAAAQYHNEDVAAYAKEQQAKMDSGEIDTSWGHAFGKRALAEQTPAKVAGMVGAAAAFPTLGMSIPAAAAATAAGSFFGDMSQDVAANMGEETAQPRDLGESLWGATKAGVTDAAVGGLMRGAGMGYKAAKSALGYGPKTAYGAADAAVNGARAYAGSGSGATGAATSPLHRTLDGVETVVDWTRPGYQSKAVKAGRTALFGNGKAASAADDVLPSGARTIDAGNVQPAQQYQQSVWPREHVSTEVPGSSWPVQGREAGIRAPWNREDIVRKAEGRNIVNAANRDAALNADARTLNVPGRDFPASETADREAAVLAMMQRKYQMPVEQGPDLSMTPPLPLGTLQKEMPPSPESYFGLQRGAEGHWTDPDVATAALKAPPNPQQEAADAMSALQQQQPGYAPDPTVGRAAQAYEEQMVNNAARNYDTDPISPWFHNKNDALWGQNSTTRLGEEPIGRTKANLVTPAQGAGDDLRAALQNSKSSDEYAKHWNRLRQRMHVEDGPKHGRKRTTAAGTARLIAERKAAYAKAQASGLPEDMLAVEALFAQRNK